MAVATNNTLLVSLKALNKAEIQNVTKFLNIKTGKINQNCCSRRSLINPVANRLDQFKFYKNKFYTFLGFFLYRHTSHTGELYKFKQM